MYICCFNVRSSLKFLVLLLYNLINIASRTGNFLFCQMEVQEIALDKCGSQSERRLCVIDKNRDLYLTQCRVYGSDRKTVKLGTNHICNYVYSLIIRRILAIGEPILVAVIVSEQLTLSSCAWPLTLFSDVDH